MVSIESRVEKTASGLAFSGVIDHQSVPALIKSLPVSGSAEMELDISAASKVDSAGLAMLIHWGNEHLQSGEKIKLRGASQQVRQLIEILGLESMFQLLDI